MQLKKAYCIPKKRKMEGSILIFRTQTTCCKKSKLLEDKEDYFWGNLKNVTS